MSYPPSVKGHPIYSSIYSYVHDYNRSYLGVATGQPGTGKSVSTMRFLYDLDRGESNKPRFNIDQVVFDPKDFLKILKDKKPKGSAIMWDEVGVAVPKREWYSLRNRLISSVFQTMRFKNRIIVMTVPALSYVDKHLGLLVNGLLQLEQSNSFQGNIAYARYYTVHYSSRQDKFYYYRPKGTTDEGLPFIGTRFGLHKPPQDLMDAYKEKQDTAKQQIIENAEDLISYMAKYIGKKERSTMTEPELFELIKGDLDNYLNFEKTKIMSSLVMVKNKGLEYRMVARVVQALNEMMKAGEFAAR